MVHKRKSLIIGFYKIQIRKLRYESLKYAYNAIKKIFLCSPANELKPTFQRELAEFALFVVATLLIHRGLDFLTVWPPKRARGTYISM